QEIARVTVAHLDDVAKVANVRDFFEQDDLHVARAPSVQVGVRQQRQKARALDRRAELALVARLGAGDARRHDLAVLLHEVLEDVDVLIIDLLDVLRGEAAELLALEQVVAALAALAVLLEPAFASSNGTWHFSFLSSFRSARIASHAA